MARAARTPLAMMMSGMKSGLALMCAFLLGSACLVSGCSSTQAFDAGGVPAQGVAVIVPDNSRHRTWDSPLEPSMVSAQVKVKIGQRSLGGMSDRYEVLPGRHELVVSLRDRHTPVTARELYTNPVVFPVTVQGGREYRVRGGVIYPPASSPHTRTLDTRQYRVIFALQDTTFRPRVIMSHPSTPPVWPLRDAGHWPLLLLMASQIFNFERATFMKSLSCITTTSPSAVS